MFARGPMILRPCARQRRHFWAVTIFSAPQRPIGRGKSPQSGAWSAHVEKTGEELIFTLTGDGFLHHMVRILVGTLLEIGAGARPVSSIAEIFASGCRANAGVTVPAQGLCLMEVQYH